MLIMGRGDDTLPSLVNSWQASNLRETSEHLDPGIRQGFRHMLPDPAPLR